MKKFLKFLFMFIILLVLIFLYARYLGTKGLIVKEYKVESSKITDNYHGLKIVHISDIHYGSTINENELDKIVTEVNKLKPDIVVLTGDLIDEGADKNILIEYLKKINATIGKYGVNGNHDSENVLEDCGVTYLENDYNLIYNSTESIIISGITSSYNENDIDYKTKKFDEYIGTLTDSKPIYSILLLHEPDYIDKLNTDNYDLILAGHSHGGQVRIPIITKYFLPNGSTKYYNDYYKVNNSDLFISSGLGTSKAKLRLFCKPSINFYRITKK